MAISPACAGVGQSLQHVPTCRSAQLYHRRSIFVRHLGSRPAISTCDGLAFARNAHPRPALPRQGRFMCQAARQTERQNPFRRAREMDGLQKILANMPATVFYGAALLLITAAGAVGFTAGSRAPAKYRQIGKGAGAVVLGATATVAATKGKERRGQAASIALYNDLMQRSDPGSITLPEVQQIGQKYGVEFNKTAVGDLQQIYNEFLTALIPTDETSLTGDEPEQIRQFKDALGLDNNAAAEVHMNLARQLMRERAEAGSRTGDSGQRKALGKLVYVSYQVFGPTQASYLMPIPRVMGIQAAGIDVMRRDNAKQLFDNYVKANGGELKAEQGFLGDLKAYQDRIQLKDEFAEEIMRDAARMKLERCIGTALECIKKRTRQRDYTPAIQALREVLDYNSQLEQLAQQPGMPKGLAKTNVYGGKFSEGGQDMRELFRVFLEESLRQQGHFSDQLEQDVTGLQQALGLGTLEASKLRDEITSKIYRRMLREEVTSGRLDAAESKAKVLQGLCEQLKFSPEAAGALHKSLYRQKIDSVLEEKKKIGDDDFQELDRQRKLLCLPKAEIETIQRETTGRLFQTAVEDAVNAGIDRFSFDDRDNVKRSKKELRISDPLAKEILDKVARKAFVQFITRSRGQRDRLEAAKELKKMVFFSNIVVAALLEDVQGDAKAKAKAEAEKQEAAKKEIAELMAKAKADMDKEQKGEAQEAQAEADDLKKEVEASEKDAELEKEKEAAGQESDAAAITDEQPSTLKKAQDAAAARKDGEEVGDSGVTMKSQKEITLANDLALRDRQDIYRNFLLYCMSGDTVALPMGSTVVVERDESEFARLSQLGEVLGLSQFDVAHVHKELAETAFRNQVTNILQTGTMTKENTEYLAGMRDKMGLSKEQAEKIIKGVQNQQLLGGLEAAKNTGQLTLQKILDMKESGVDVDSFISEEMRLSLYAQEIKSVLANGTGVFDEERLLHQLPKELSLPEKKVKRSIEDQAKDKKRTTLVQAISFYRQKKMDDTVKALNNLVACNKALPSEEAVQWREQEELQDLYSVYIGKDKDTAKQQVLQKLFKLSDSDAQSLRDVVESGQFRVDAEDDDSSFF